MATIWFNGVEYEVKLQWKELDGMWYAADAIFYDGAWYPFLELTQGKVAVVDWPTFIEVERLGRKYCFGKKYAQRSHYGSTVYLHQDIMGRYERGMEVHHINAIKLDYRRSNLTVVSVRTNQHATGPRGGKSGLKGVHFHKPTGKWAAVVRFADGKQHYLGLFACKYEAGREYNRIALREQGPLAYQNPIPEGACCTAG